MQPQRSPLNFLALSRSLRQALSFGLELAQEPVLGRAHWEEAWTCWGHTLSMLLYRLLLVVLGIALPFLQKLVSALLARFTIALLQSNTSGPTTSQGFECERWQWCVLQPLLVPSAWVNGGICPRVPFLPLSACCKEVNCHPFFSLFWIKGCIDRSRTPPFFIVFLQIWYQWQATAGSNINRIWSIINRSGVSFRNSQKCFLPHFAKLCLLFLTYFSIPVTVLSSL